MLTMNIFLHFQHSSKKSQHAVEPGMFSPNTGSTLVYFLTCGLLTTTLPKILPLPLQQPLNGLTSTWLLLCYNPNLKPTTPCRNLIGLLWVTHTLSIKICHLYGVYLSHAIDLIMSTKCVLTMFLSALHGLYCYWNM